MTNPSPAATGSPDPGSWNDHDQAAGVIRGIRFQPRGPVHAARAEETDGTAAQTLCGRDIPWDTATSTRLVWREETQRCKACHTQAKQWFFATNGNGPRRP